MFGEFCVDSVDEGRHGCDMLYVYADEFHQLIEEDYTDRLAEVCSCNWGNIGG